METEAALETRLASLVYIEAVSSSMTEDTMAPKGQAFNSRLLCEAAVVAHTHTCSLNTQEVAVEAAEPL